MPRSCRFADNTVFRVYMVIARSEATKQSQECISNEDCHASRGSARNDSFYIFSGPEARSRNPESLFFSSLTHFFHFLSGSAPNEQPERSLRGVIVFFFSLANRIRKAFGIIRKGRIICNDSAFDIWWSREGLNLYRIDLITNVLSQLSYSPIIF